MSKHEQSEPQSGSTITPKRGRGRTPMASQAEVQERIRIVADMLVRHIHKHQIKRALADKYGLGFRQAENYIARAREYLIERSNRPRKDHISEAFSFYESILRDPEATRAEKMAAQRDIRQLLGLDAPMRVASTTPDGEAVSSNVSIVISQLPDEKLQVLRDIRRQVLGVDRPTAIANLTDGNSDSNAVALDGDSSLLDDDVIDGEVLDSSEGDGEPTAAAPNRQEKLMRQANHL